MMVAQTGSGQLDFVLRHVADLLWGVPNNRPGGLVMTLLLSVVGIGVGMAVAVMVSAARQSRFAVMRWLATNYVRVVRGVPLILVLLLVHRLVAVSLGAANAFRLPAGIVVVRRRGSGPVQQRLSK